MRSRVVPMRDMKEKFGAEVKSFHYSFVLPDHGSEWDGSNSLEPEMARAVLSKARAAAQAQRSESLSPAFPALSALSRIGSESPSAPRRRASDRQPTFIEVKPRS